MEVVSEPSFEALTVREKLPIGEMCALAVLTKLQIRHSWEWQQLPASTAPQIQDRFLLLLVPSLGLAARGFLAKDVVLGKKGPQ